MQVEFGEPEGLGISTYQNKRDSKALTMIEMNSIYRNNFTNRMRTERRYQGNISISD
ncbi:hypothetical protein Hanom_Chr13g01206721 [Helianthus anomalus]